jgi:hypothetical protein
VATNRKPEENANLQRILEERIKRHGLMSSYYKGCRCERCKKAVSINNKRCYESYGNTIKKNASLRSKYSIECRNWVEEFFPEVAEQLKNAVIERQNDGL